MKAIYKTLKYLSITGFLLVGLLLSVSMLKDSDDSNIVGAYHECKHVLMTNYGVKNIRIGESLDYLATRKISKNKYEVNIQYFIGDKEDFFRCKVSFDGEYQVNLI